MAELPLDTAGCAITKTDELKALLRARFCAPEWALFFEVMEGTGWQASRGRADAVAMNLYPSRGLTVNGCELKVSRTDWLREMKDGAKAEVIFGFCDHWWLVVGDRQIVKDGELPEPWGLIAPRAGQLAIVKQAPKLKPAPLTREFFAMLARRANDAANEIIQGRIDAATADLKGRINELLKKLEEAHRTGNRQMAEQVKAFEEASGLSIADSWRGAQIGAVVKAVLDHGVQRQRYGAQHALQIIERLGKDMRALLKLLPKEET